MTRQGSAAPHQERHRPVVRLEQVWKTYGEEEAEVTALAGVSVAFPASSFTAIMGPSGSGKTTLLQCAAGLADPTRGRVVLGDTDIAGMRERELALIRRERMGFVFQAFNLLPALTGRENVMLPLRLAGRRVDRRWLETIIRRTGMIDHIDRFPHQLSGGQQQRIAICRALMARPEVVFADEPTGALDSATGEEILDLLRSSVDELGQTVVMVTHEPIAAAHADQVLFLRDGQIVGSLRRPTIATITHRLAELSGAR
ncbi:ATP-binding cassette domain-containing protein [Nocardiopsis alba]|uniref:ATP-binding cassette domain-containing protein n=1 Tax=Nocardiopsis alba TaxID=53437 RepID=A0A7K2ISX7_9ACTN|nr:ABC transporter ATP-binding protein [Nocardiopsis alba]MYR32957.1 ATP-binding cassette domain-containing protein [Nocardiopsis alba]